MGRSKPGGLKSGVKIWIGARVLELFECLGCSLGILNENVCVDHTSVVHLIGRVTCMIKLNPGPRQIYER